MRDWNKTSWNHEQLLKFLSTGENAGVSQKPAWLKTFESSLLFNKYANIGSQNDHDHLVSNMNNDFGTSAFNRFQESKYGGTASILTNSSISASNWDNLPLQMSMNNASASSTKAITILQEKIAVLERENSFLREIVTTNENNAKQLQENNAYIDKLEDKFKEEIQKAIAKEQSMSDRILELQDTNDQLAEYVESQQARIRELENMVQSNKSEDNENVACK